MDGFKYAIFDFDGTLADSQWYWQTMMPRIFMEKGYPVTDQDVEACLDCGWLDYYNIFRERFGVKEPLFRHWTDLLSRVEEFYRNEVYWKPTVPEYLQKLKEQDVTLSIFSATPEPLLRVALKRLEGEKYFDRIFSVATIGIGKNDPKSFQYCLQQLGASLDNTVLFEDALYSIETAKSMGMTVYAVRDRGNRLNEDKIRALADHYAVYMKEFI